MQRIFHFELGMAIKDRPKSFQVITLFLFTFSLAMLLFCTLARLTATDNNHQVLQNKEANRYTNITTSLHTTTHMKK